MAGCSAGLAVNTDLGTSLWPLFVLPALAAGFAALDEVAAAFGDTVSVVSGGLACIAGALVLARLRPGFRQQRTPTRAAPQAGQENSLPGVSDTSNNAQG